MEKSYWEDYKIGEQIVTPARTITETDLVQFSALTGDWHPLHSDIEYASKSIFGERIAHGMLVLVIGSVLGRRLGEFAVTPRSFIALYSIDSVKFSRPVKIGDTIHLVAETVETTAKDDHRGLVISKSAIKNQHGDDCCTYTTTFMCGREPSGEQ